jgi:hypothetical protein
MGTQDYYGRHVFSRTPDNYRSKAQWARSGRVPCCEATAIVIKETELSQGLSAPAERLKEFYTPVVAELGDDRWVAVHCLKLALRDFGKLSMKEAWTLGNSRKMFARGGSRSIG